MNLVTMSSVKACIAGDGRRSCYIVPLVIMAVLVSGVFAQDAAGSNAQMIEQLRAEMAEIKDKLTGLLGYVEKRLINKDMVELNQRDVSQKIPQDIAQVQQDVLSLLGLTDAVTDGISQLQAYVYQSKYNR